MLLCLSIRIRFSMSRDDSAKKKELLLRRLKGLKKKTGLRDLAKILGS